MQSVRLQQRKLGAGSQAVPVRSRRHKLTCDASVVWRQLEGTKAWVAHPRAARVKGIIHFLGGAFAGAAPQILYNSFVEQLANAGFTTIATPYAVTFRHDECAKQVRQTFVDSISELKSNGRSYLVPAKATVFGVGHSNGALLHLLIGSLEPSATAGNVVISFNNLQVADAIPIPGFLETLQPTLQAARSANTPLNQDPRVDSSLQQSRNSSSSSLGGSSTPGRRPASASAQLLAVAAAAASPLLAEQQQQLLVGAAPALDQLASVINEVGDGLTDFRPTPEESRAIIAAGYSCPDTLLVQFDDDPIDETPEMLQILTERFELLGTTATAAAALAAVQVPEAVEVEFNAGSSIGTGVYTNGVQNSLQQPQQQQQYEDIHGAQAGQQKAQQLLLPGSHVTPCGAQLGQDNADFKNLTQKVLSWLEARRSGSGAVAAGRQRAASPQQSQQEGLQPAVSAAAGQNAQCV